MKTEYDFSKMNGKKNRYAQRLKKQVTIRLGQDIIYYFKSLARESDIPYQKLINLYLRECVQTHKKLSWVEENQSSAKERSVLVH